MLEKIRVDQLEMGMHVHSLCGRWIDHPFWRTRFVLQNPRDLTDLRASGITECWIDAAKGPRPGAGQRAAPERPPWPTKSSQCGDDANDASLHEQPARAVRTAFDDEIVRAASVCRQATLAVRSLFREVRLGRALDVERSLPLADAIASSVSRHPGALLSLARIRTHHGYTFLHSVAVSALMFSLARQLGMDEAKAREAGMAGLLHDVGKAAIPGAVLNKPGKLDRDEFALMKNHPQLGHDLLQRGGAAGETILDVCLHHHERYDGKGYPDGLHGETLTLAARMNAVCDVYDAITSTRPYKGAWDPAESLAHMASWTQNGQFDPDVFRAFVNAVGIYPLGSLVRMQSGRLALVVEHNAAAPARPCVKVFYSSRSRMPIPVERIDLSRPGNHDRIVARESNAQWRFTHLEELLLGADSMRRAAAV